MMRGMATTRLRRVWDEGGTAFGCWCMLPASHGAEMLASMGFDYVCVDWQHGLLGYEATAAMLQAMTGVDVTPIVRVPANDRGAIGKALDAGAEGIVVPLVNSADEARRAAAACRYPPEGVRSFGLARARLSLGRDTAGVNEGVVCLPMVETREAVDRLDEICGAPGVDGIYIGPSDLAVSLGVEQGSDEHARAVARIREACEGAGVVPGIHTYDGSSGRARAEEGFRMVTIAADMALLAGGALRELGEARG